MKNTHGGVLILVKLQALAITVTIRGTSSEKLFLELGLDTLKLRHWLRKLCLFLKPFEEKSPAHLFQLTRENSTPYATRSLSFKNKLLRKFFLSCGYNGVE